jgi:hypothetical protein
LSYSTLLVHLEIPKYFIPLQAKRNIDNQYLYNVTRYGKDRKENPKLEQNKLSDESASIWSFIWAGKKNLF